MEKLLETLRKAHEQTQKYLADSLGTALNRYEAHIRLLEHMLEVSSERLEALEDLWLAWKKVGESGVGCHPDFTAATHLVRYTRLTRDTFPNQLLRSRGLTGELQGSFWRNPPVM
jgi:hypothetical protein